MVWTRLIKRARQAREELSRSYRRRWKENDMGMDKHGYEQDEKDPKVKTAADRDVCPLCGSKLTGSPPVCPKHGSEPFEKKEGK